ARYGLEVTETSRDVSFCGHVVAQSRALVVEDTLADERFADNPLVVGGPRVRFYAGFPLRTPEGHVLGTLCVLDRARRVVTDEQRRMLDILAGQVVDALELRRKLIALAASERARADDQRTLARSNQLLDAMMTAQQAYLLGESVQDVFSMLLEHVLRITESEFGFMGEVLRGDDGLPYLKNHAISNIAWSAATRKFFDDNVRSGLEFHNLETLFGAVLKSGAPVLTNDPSRDSRRGGLPPGHPPLRGFLGLPVRRGEHLLGMIGVANRPRGYDWELVEFLRPLLASCASLISARRAEAARAEAQARLAASLEALRRSHDELAQLLDLLSVGTVILDAERRVAYISEMCRACAGLDDSARGQSWQRVLPLDARAVAALGLCMELPEPERTRVGGRITSINGVVHVVEIDVRDDPRDRRRRVLFLYDVSELHELLHELSGGRHAGMIGESEVMQELYRSIDQVAAGDWTVLIRGETGSGKELVARAVHAASHRHRGPFVAVNCAGLTDTLLSSQLFGHVKGAFTGATRDQAGLFESASGGTIFLDEIGDISLAMQRSLLRVLQEREVTRVGETRARAVDVRVIAATHRDLEAMTADGEFREDLLYRIRIARVDVPPLRDRLVDIPALIAAFLADERVHGGKAVRGISRAALERLQRHAWPGNVRELKGAIQHAVVRCQRDAIDVGDLPPELVFGASRASPRASSGPEPPMTAARRDDPSGAASEPNERARLLEALRRAGGNRSKAARLLGIGRATLYRRIKHLGLDVTSLT
ncbi:MAG: sigma 54-interacting transcriptional regulator, partial [Myxococcales bacterium]|nr:sigma 54-interacting transcriptional regulator [Myxococcales bacterium]